MVYHPLATTPDGEVPLDALRAAIRDVDDPHDARPGIICLENTHNRCGGTVLRPSYMASVRALADKAGLPIHLDGARLPNAAVALGVPMRELTRDVTSVQLDLSKGLAAPVGGVVAGSRSFIARALRARKVVGGGMRQAGIIAAAGIVALEEMVDRLAEDHANAKLLAEGLAAIDAISIEPERVQTDIVVFRWRDGDVAAADRFIAALREHSVLLGGFGDGRLRMVTHYGISRQDIEATLQAVQRVSATH
jgi:threonine aldolase